VEYKMSEQNVDNSPSRGTEKYPEPMTANALKSYLEFASEDYSIDNQPVLVDGKPILKGELRRRRVTLHTEHRYPLAPMTTRSFKRYLEMATGGIFVESGFLMVMYNDEILVNAKIDSGCVVLETTDKVAGFQF
jgi:hypothetical protein